MHETYIQLVKEIQSIQKEWSFSEPKTDILSEFKIDRALSDLTVEYFKEEMKLFKGAQHFFEKNGRKHMADAFLNKLNEALEDYYANQQNKLNAHFEEVIHRLSLSLIEEMKIEGHERLKGMEMTLDKQSNPTIYLEAEKQIKLLVDKEENEVAVGKRA